MLALYLKRYPDELEADFQQHYGLDLEELGRGLSIRKAAVLAAQLPVDSRCCIAMDPDRSWSTEAWMLRSIEAHLATYMWSQSDKRKRGPKPKPRDTPSEARKVLTSIGSTDFEYIANSLGVTHGD